MKPNLRRIIQGYLTFLARVLIKRWQPRFIVITGTAGKTTTKSVIFSVLKEKYGPRVSSSYGSMGTVIGLPLALNGIEPSWVNHNQVGPPYWQWPYWLALATGKTFLFWFGINQYPKIWVVEFTADKPGDFDYLLSYVRPEISIITNIGPGHLEFFSSCAGVAKEKGRIVERLPKSGVAILNGHDLFLQKIARQTKAKVYWVWAEGLQFAPAAGRIVGRLFGLNDQQIQHGLDSVKSPAHRFDILEGRLKTTIIDSTYNANPVSLMAVITEARKMALSRLIAVVGDMLELGPDSRDFHKQAGQKIKKIVDVLITIGPQARFMRGEYHAKNIDDVVSFLGRTIQTGDTIVVKASHGMRLDRLVKKLVAGE